MMPIYLLVPEKPSYMLQRMIESFTSDLDVIKVEDTKNLPDLRNKKIILAIQLDDSGINLNLYKIIKKLYERGHDSLFKSHGSLLIHSPNDLYTKSVAQNIIFNLNRLGCSFPGRPLVEATDSLRNFLTLQKVINLPLEDVCLTCCKNLSERFINYYPRVIENPKILVLHASNEDTSNTLRLWNMVKKHLNGYEIKQIHIENGTVRDCKGCPYKTCKHYGKHISCFYGGIMVEEIYPNVLDSDAIVWITPNYNDAVSANLTAVINRLTALFRKTKFYDKNLFGIIVSGNSGSDSVAKQLISALNMNKTFRLPPYFSIMATANDKDAILKVEDIEKKAEEFAKNIKNELKA